ncbi:MAG TPA: hypothetical protein VGF21_08505 [Thermoleophilaceae bacterium]|jgi:hypothetical protein
MNAADTAALNEDNDIAGLAIGSGIVFIQIAAVMPGLLPCLLLVLPFVIPVIVLGAVAGIVIGVPLGIWHLVKAAFA